MMGALPARYTVADRASAAYSDGMRKRITPPSVPPERALAETWQRAAGAGPLTTVGGAELRVVFPGRRNPGAGPDFLDAILETEAGEVRGAVELHRRTSDWQRHQHDADPRYAGVVLHVVGRDDGGAGRLPGGAQLPLLELGGAARAEWPEGPALRFPCAAALQAGQDLLPALRRAGEARFQAATERARRELGRRLGGKDGAAARQVWEQVTYELLAEALGYSRNVAAMRELAAGAPLEMVQAYSGRVDPEGEPARAAADRSPGSPSLRAEALLLGAAGLLPSQRHLRAARRDAYAAALERAWTASGAPIVLRAYRWDAGQVRPENAPVRRVVALAHLALRWPSTGLLAQVRERLAAGARRANRRLADLVTLPCPPGYWAERWDFGVPARPSGDTAAETAALIGPSRAADAVVNVLLPLAAAAGEMHADEALREHARAAYQTHPLLAENWITRLVRERTGLPAGTRGHPDAVSTACAQQGLIAIYEGPCRDLRCAECPLGAPGAR